MDLWTRKKKLESCLKSRGLELRNDSALCSNFIDGTTDLDLNYIVQRMCEMKYLYEYCNMKKIKKQVYYKKKSHNALNNVNLDAEIIALNKYSDGKYPNKFPWELYNELNNFYIGITLYLLTIIAIPTFSCCFI